MNDMILILNYSDEFSLEVARRLRAENVYGRIISGMTTAAQVAELNPKGIILCGAAGNAPGVFDAGIVDLGIPVLALGHASHMLLAAQGGASAGVAIVEKKANIQYEASDLFTGMESEERLAEDMDALLKSMSPLDETILRKKYYDGMSYIEISQELAIPYDTVKKRGERGLKKALKRLPESCFWWLQRRDNN